MDKKTSILGSIFKKLRNAWRRNKNVSNLSSRVMESRYPGGVSDSAGNMEEWKYIRKKLSEGTFDPTSVKKNR